MVSPTYRPKFGKKAVVTEYDPQRNLANLKKTTEIRWRFKLKRGYILSFPIRNFATFPTFLPLFRLICHFSDLAAQTKLCIGTYLPFRFWIGNSRFASYLRNREQTTLRGKGLVPSAQPNRKSGSIPNRTRQIHQTPDYSLKATLPFHLLTRKRDKRSFASTTCCTSRLTEQPISKLMSATAIFRASSYRMTLSEAISIQTLSALD